MVRDLLEQANSAMRHNRRRTALTMLGMAWGIATVVLLLAYGSGFGRAITTIFSHFGVKIIGVFPGRTSQQAGGQKAEGQYRRRQKRQSFEVARQAPRQDQHRGCGRRRG